MARLDGFNSSDYDDPGFDPLPEGVYLLIIESSELKPTKAGTGTGINFKFKVIDGDFKGRTFFKWLNYTNPNETAQRIGRAELSMLCRATNVPDAKDTMEMHNIPFYAKVVVTPADGKYDAGNDIKKAVTKSDVAKLTDDDKNAETAKSGKSGDAPWAK
jgi:hypothetical protein